MNDNEEQKRTPQQAVQFAKELHQNGRLTGAEAIYASPLKTNKNNHEILHFLGLLNFQK
jgi:glutaminase